MLILKHKFVVTLHSTKSRYKMVPTFVFLESVMYRWRRMMKMRNGSWSQNKEIFCDISFSCPSLYLCKEGLGEVSEGCSTLFQPLMNCSSPLWQPGLRTAALRSVPCLRWSCGPASQTDSQFWRGCECRWVGSALCTQQQQQWYLSHTYSPVFLRRFQRWPCVSRLYYVQSQVSVKCSNRDQRI